MKIHFLLGVMVIILATILNVTRFELLILFLTVGLVITAELINTAIEEVVNLVTQEYHPLAKIAKNVAAGAVLVTSVISLFVAYLVFVERLVFFQPALLRQSFSKPHLTLMALGGVLFVIIAVKAMSGRNQFLRGGMPSGHSAVAFSLATAIFFIGDGLVVFLGLVLAGLVSQSRVEGEIHSAWEVISGALLGILITLFFFQMKG